ncbi:transposase [Streptomyces sp. NPDC085614]|uniref:transposase n=1 Tax=Streptomyces sp. NPDC085614 TaxID=3365733 RepID=UPI0037CF5937
MTSRIPLESGKFLYPATVIDLASRRLAGWALAEHMRTELVTDALAAAQRTRGSLTGAVMQTDHGSQYTSRAFTQACTSAGVRQSMGAIGSSADNTLAESFNATFKRETPQGRKAWPNNHEARLDAFRWLHRHNTRRRHSRLGQRKPHHLRDGRHNNGNYAGRSRITRVRDSRSRPVIDGKLPGLLTASRRPAVSNHKGLPSTAGS